MLLFARAKAAYRFSKESRETVRDPRFSSCGTQPQALQSPKPMPAITADRRCGVLWRTLALSHYHDARFRIDRRSHGEWIVIRSTGLVLPLA